MPTEHSTESQFAVNRRDPNALVVISRGCAFELRLSRIWNGYSLYMGTNVTRLIRTDHRRIGELIGRLGRRYRAGEALPAKVVGEVSAHVDASATCLLPFTASRVDLDPAFVGTFDALTGLAAELDHSDHPVPAELVDRLRTAFNQHADIEERTVLEPLDKIVSVERLRVLGEAFRRHRDSRLKAEGEPGRRYQRPPPSRAELYERARYRGIAGRSSMSRSELLTALREVP